RVQKAYFAILLYLLGLAAGITTTSIHRFDFRQDHYLNGIPESKKPLLMVVVREKLKQSVAGARYVAEVESVNLKRKSGKILLQFRAMTSFQIGTRLMILGSPMRNRPPKNPGQCDSGEYLDNKAIPAQLFLSRHDF